MILEARFSTCYPDALDESCNWEFTTRIKYPTSDRGALWWNSQSFDVFVSSILVQRLLEEFREKKNPDISFLKKACLLYKCIQFQKINRGLRTRYDP